MTKSAGCEEAHLVRWMLTPITTLCPCSWQTSGPPLSFCSGVENKLLVRRSRPEKKACFPLPVCADGLTSHTPSPLLPPAQILLWPASPLICEHMSLLTIGMTTALSDSSCPVSGQIVCELLNDVVMQGFFFPKLIN